MPWHRIWFHDVTDSRRLYVTSKRQLTSILHDVTCLWRQSLCHWIRTSSFTTSMIHDVIGSGRQSFTTSQVYNVTMTPILHTTGVWCHWIRISILQDVTGLGRHPSRRQWFMTSLVHDVNPSRQWFMTSLLHDVSLRRLLYPRLPPLNKSQSRKGTVSIF